MNYLNIRYFNNNQQHKNIIINIIPQVDMFFYGKTTILISRTNYIIMLRNGKAKRNLCDIQYI